MPHNKRRFTQEGVIALAFAFILSCIFALVFTQALSSGTNGNANLTIYDEIDLNGDLVKISNTALFFFANYTNSSGSRLNQTVGNSVCRIAFNFNSSYDALTNMTYNISTAFWQYNRTFNYKGTHYFQVNCTSIYGNVTLNDTFVITNTVPTITSTSGGGFVDLDGNTFTNDRLSCSEDALCIYNFSANVSDPDLNDVLTYNYSSANTTLTDFAFNGTSSILSINVSTTSGSGNRQIELNVRDSESPLQSGILRVNISSVNDAPLFSNLANKSFNITQEFYYAITSSDEEGDAPYIVNLSFVSCIVAPWSTRNCSTAVGRELFNVTYYTTNATLGTLTINFTPTRNDVGNYTINFSIQDSGSPNAVRSELIQFSVLNLNEYPYYQTLCNNERNATEGQPFSCMINVSDIDETLNLTIRANESWFTFNPSLINFSTKPVNNTSSYNASFIVNFTPTDIAVGNWSINISLMDFGVPQHVNSTLITFYVENVNDSVFLGSIANMTAFTSNMYTIYVNASDNDLLIPDKRVYNESLVFSSNNTNVGIQVIALPAQTNITSLALNFSASSLGSGNHSINISVRDANSFSAFSRVFIIQVIGNSQPQWSASVRNNQTLLEGMNLYLNLSQNVSDADNQALTFTYLNDSSFPSFTLSSGGILNVTGDDEDVGAHFITINVSDGIITTSLLFNITIYNVLDSPFMITPLQTSNISVDASSNMNTSEDTPAQIIFWVDDNDVAIPFGQKLFYNESLNVSNLTIQGNNRALFTFSKSADFPSSQYPNRTQFMASFTPNKSDVGVYNISLNITDLSTNRSTFIRFNLSIAEVQHGPTLTSLGNLTASILETLYLDFNATDPEDIDEVTSGSNLTYRITNLTSGGNFLTINRSTGIINFTLNRTRAGTWLYNVSVNDTTGRLSSLIFSLKVYDYPVFISPSASSTFFLLENTTRSITFTANHSVGDILNYTLYINGSIRNQTSSLGNGTAFSWNFTSNFSDETTCIGLLTLTINASNSKLSNASTWSVAINHTDYPLNFSSFVGGSSQLLSGGASLSAALASYFTDFDASDTCYNQSIGFSYTLVAATSGTIGVSIINWSNGVSPNATFYASSTSNGIFNLTAYEYNLSNPTQVINTVYSNNFTVDLSVSTTPDPTPTSSGGGSSGGGGGVQPQPKPVALKVIVPGAVTAKRNQTIFIPITLQNSGSITLYNVSLKSDLSRNGFLLPNIRSSFDINHTGTLAPLQRINTTLRVRMDSNELGTYDITVNATSQTPYYSDWGKIIVTLQEGDTTLDEKIIFTEELIADNPDCVEITELVDEAKKYYSEGNVDLAQEKIEEAINGCRNVIAGKNFNPALARLLPQHLFSYVSVMSIIVIALGIVYYYIGRIRLRQQTAI